MGTVAKAGWTLGWLRDAMGVMQRRCEVDARNELGFASWFYFRLLHEVFIFVLLEIGHHAVRETVLCARCVPEAVVEA